MSLLKNLPGTTSYTPVQSVYGPRYAQLYAMLCTIAPPAMVVLTRTRLADLITVEGPKKGQEQALAAIASQYVDFVIVNRLDFSIVLPIQFEAPVSGMARFQLKSADVKARDRAFTKAELAVLQIEDQPGADIGAIRGQIITAAGHLLGGLTPVSTSTSAVEMPAELASAPISDAGARSYAPPAIRPSTVA